MRAGSGYKLSSCVNNGDADVSVALVASTSYVRANGCDVHAVDVAIASCDNAINDTLFDVVVVFCSC